MSGMMSRRKALAAGATTAGLFAAASCTENQTGMNKPETRESRWQESEWSRGPNKNLKRDLTPGPTPIRLACSSFTTRLWYPEDKSITEAVKSIRDQGYTSAGVAHGPYKHNKWLDATDSEVTELKAALKKYDVTFFDMMTYDNILHPDRAIREKGIQHVTENLEAAEKCGAQSVCAGLGTCDSEFGLSMHPDNWTEETWKLGVDGIKQILRDTSGFKAVLGMEAVITTPLDGPMALKRLREDVGDPHVQVALDPANMFTIANYYHSTEMINRCFDILGEDIACCHGKDTFIERDKMLALMTMKPAGKGVQDYETYLVRMSHLKYPRTLLLEFAQPEEYPAAKAFVEETAARVGVKIYS
ncbi:MAG: sugar phosphate isomerase/epimerase [Candidatus Latescibacteria bacterium]|nr:sugar phosphate isomerase/epimerase [Candidatus Latescibacterota bacterium]